MESIAAAGDGECSRCRSPVKPTLLRRLPANYQQFSTSAHLLRVGAGIGGSSCTLSEAIQRRSLYERHEGGLLSRALGNAVHAFLEELSRLARRTSIGRRRAQTSEDGAPHRRWHSRFRGGAAHMASKIAAEALQLALNASRDSRASGFFRRMPMRPAKFDGRSVSRRRCARCRWIACFAPGSAPRQKESNCWWIVDYKTAPQTEDSSRRSAARVCANCLRRSLRLMRQSCAICTETNATLCAGLYYPRMLVLDWWEM